MGELYCENFASTLTEITCMKRQLARNKGQAVYLTCIDCEQGKTLAQEHSDIFKTMKIVQHVNRRTISPKKREI